MGTKLGVQNFSSSNISLFYSRIHSGLDNGGGELFRGENLQRSFRLILSRVNYGLQFIKQINSVPSILILFFLFCFQHLHSSNLSEIILCTRHLLFSVLSSFSGFSQTNKNENADWHFVQLI